MPLVDVDSCPHDVDNDEDSDALCSVTPVSFSRLDSLQLLRESFPLPKLQVLSNNNACSWDHVDTARAFGLDKILCLQATQVNSPPANASAA